jgi:hypothetical protein
VVRQRVLSTRLSVQTCGQTSRCIPPGGLLPPSGGVPLAPLVTDVKQGGRALADSFFEQSLCQPPLGPSAPRGEPACLAHLLFLPTNRSVTFASQTPQPQQAHKAFLARVSPQVSLKLPLPRPAGWLLLVLFPPLAVYWQAVGQTRLPGSRAGPGPWRAPPRRLAPCWPSRSLRPLRGGSCLWWPWQMVLGARSRLSTQRPRRTASAPRCSSRSLW